MLGVAVGGRYQLASLLGMGGMGAVFAAEHTAIGRKVALKLLLPDLLGTREVVERFSQEARAAAGIQRRGVVDVLDFGVDPQHGAFLVMERLEGEAFSKLLARAAPLAPAEAVRILGQVLDTLSAVHQRGIVHRDLKPGNVFLARTEEGEQVVKVLDFGISRMAPPPGKSAITLPGTVLGTPRYMSPEQAMSLPDVDARADLYSVGAMLYGSLCGRQPYSEFRPEEVLVKMLERGPTSLRTMRAGLPEALYAVVDVAMARDRKNRFQSAAEMLAALRAAVPDARITPAPAPALASGPTDPGARASLPTPVSTHALTPQGNAFTPKGVSAFNPPTSPSIATSPRVAPGVTAAPPIAFAPATHAPVTHAPAPALAPALAQAPAPAPSPNRAARWPWILGGVLLLVVGGGGVAAGLFLGGREDVGGANRSSPIGSMFSRSGSPDAYGVVHGSDANDPTVVAFQSRLDGALATARRGQYDDARAQLERLHEDMRAVTVPHGEEFSRVLGNVVITLAVARAQLISAPDGDPFSAFNTVMQRYATAANTLTESMGSPLGDVQQCSLVALGRINEQLEGVFTELNARPPTDPSMAMAAAMSLNAQRGRYYDLAGQYYQRALGVPPPVDSRCTADARAGIDRVAAAHPSTAH